MGAFLGTTGYPDLQIQPVLVERLDEDGAVIGSNTLRRHLRAERSGSVGLELGMAMGRQWSISVAGSLGRTRLTQSFDGPEEWAVNAAEVPVAEDPGIGLFAWMAAVQYRITTGLPLSTYLRVGFGSERWRSDAALPAGAGGAQAVTRYSGLAVVGGEYQLTPTLAVGVRANTVVFRTPLMPAVAGTELGRTDTVVLTAQAPAARRFADEALELVRTTRLELGLTYRPAGAAVEPEDPPESDETTSPPHQ